jgi:hypothetical protein
MCMKLPLLRSNWQAFSVCFVALLVLGLVGCNASAQWQRDDAALAWKAGSGAGEDGRVIWRFSHDPAKGKPFFDPLTVAGGPALTNFRPEDHPWHYGLWFSWKYINKANYWEEDRASGKAEGSTRWSEPTIVTHADGSASITLELTYTNAKDGDVRKGKLDMTEKRTLNVSAVAPDGSYSIDWRARFTAGPDGAELDRTPLLGEPGGAVNGGYAGLGLRLANRPLVLTDVTVDGPVTQWASDRARPNGPAVGCNFASDGKDIGGIAIFSDPANTKGPATWYLINSPEMRFACPSLLAPGIIKLAPGATLDLHYLIAVSPTAWTPDSLKARYDAWIGAAGAK